MSELSQSGHIEEIVKQLQPGSSLFFANVSAEIGFRISEERTPRDLRWHQVMVMVMPLLKFHKDIIIEFYGFIVGIVFVMVMRRVEVERSGRSLVWIVLFQVAVASKLGLVVYFDREFAVDLVQEGSQPISIANTIELDPLFLSQASLG
jgi:hypothetical protein